MEETKVASDPKVKQFLEDLNELIRALQEGRISPEEAHARMAELEKAMNQWKQDNAKNAEEVEKKLQEAAAKQQKPHAELTPLIDALKEIFDPEIPANIYDLGLIYGVEVSDGGHAVVTMTLTTPHCPVAESMPAEVELRVGAVPGVGDVEVNLVWDPPWDPQLMSDEAKLELGML